MSETNQQPFIRNEMFQTLRDTGATAAVFLKNGIRLIGKIKDFDSEDILITGQTPMGLAVAREAIATVGEFKPNDQRQEQQPMKR